MNIQKAISKVEHPAIATTLLNLGMLKDITVALDRKAALTLVLPIPNVPDNIRDFLIKSLESTIQSGVEVLSNVKLGLMA